MATINYVGSLRYDMHGRKRKCVSLKQKKRGGSSVGRAPALHAGGREFESRSLHQQTREDRIKLLAPLKSDFERAKEIKEQMQFEKEKREISRGYTVAPAYNKGAYQVIPRTDVKHIGK